MKINILLLESEVPCEKIRKRRRKNVALIHCLLFNLPKVKRLQWIKSFSSNNLRQLKPKRQGFMQISIFTYIHNNYIWFSKNPARHHLT